MAWTKQEQEEARERLKEILRPGDTLWFVMRHRSRSGMSRYMDVVLFTKMDPKYVTGRTLKSRAIEKSWLTYNIACACGYQFNRRESSRGAIHYETLVVGGWGFDAACDVTMNLSRRLFGDDRKLSYQWV